MKDLFLTEKGRFEERYFYAKQSVKQDIVVKFDEPKYCQKCRSPYSEVINGLSVCSNDDCGMGRRSIGDIPRLPSLRFNGVRMVGHKLLEGS